MLVFSAVNQLFEISSEEDDLLPDCKQECTEETLCFGFEIDKYYNALGKSPGYKYYCYLITNSINFATVAK